MTWDTSNCVSLCVSAGRSDKESENGVRERERERKRDVNAWKLVGNS